MLTEIEKLNHEIELLELESQSYKNNHEWGNWENWRAFIKLDIKIKDLQKEILDLEVAALKEALINCENH